MRASFVEQIDGPSSLSSRFARGNEHQYLPCEWFGTKSNSIFFSLPCGGMYKIDGEGFNRLFQPITPCKPRLHPETRSSSYFKPVI